MKLTLEEVIARTGITERNVKYWSAIYDLQIERRGRRNYYPTETVELLEAISSLSELQLFSTSYIRWLVDIALERELAESELFERYSSLHTELADKLDLPLPVPGRVTRKLEVKTERPPASAPKADTAQPRSVYRYRPARSRDEEEAIL